jgi:predicted metal-dependent RNase
VAGRYPTFIEEDIRRQILNEAAKYESENVKRLEKENKTLAIEKDDALRRYDFISLSVMYRPSEEAMF